MSPRVRSGGALLLVVAATLTFSVGGSAAIADPDFPTWEEVQAARANEATAAVAVEEIEGILVALEAQAMELGKQAQLAGEAYNVARDELEAAIERAERLSAQADVAEERAAESTRQAARLVVQLSRTAGTDPTLSVLFSSDAGDLLQQLAAMNRLSEQSARIYDQAVTDRNLAQSLTDQAKVAQERREELAVETEAAFVAAEDAAQAALDVVAEHQAEADQLYEQLALLKGTTAAIERGYLDGIAWEEQQPPDPPDPGPSPTTPPVTPPTDPPPDPTPTDPPPSPSKVAGAIAFAKAQLGEPYQFAGSGPNSWDCSGLTKASYASVGVNIGSHYVSSQYYTMSNRGRLVPKSQMVAGDLLFYANGGSPGGGFYHVTMYIGGGKMIEAPRAGVPVRIANVRHYDLVGYVGRPTP